MNSNSEASDSPLPAKTGGNGGSEEAKAVDPGGKKGFRVVIVLFVAVVAIIAGLVANQLQLIELSWPNLEREQAEPARIAPATPAPPQPVQPAPPPQSSASSEEVSNLLSTIEGLRGDLEAMNAAQGALRESIRRQQQMNLQVRLRWISDPDSRLPQIKLAWEEISLLNSLSESQRGQAEEMHTLARDSEERLRQWREHLHKWADTLVIPEHHNILPKADHPWLGWITGQFRLYRAPTEENRRQARLRQNLIQAANRLALEEWPAEGDWQKLRAELLLQAKAGEPADSSAAVDLGLPENFDAIRADIDSLRQTAKQWQEQLS